jgi:hypothetical protein
VHAVDGFELASVKDTVAIEVVQLEEGFCERENASDRATPAV